MTVSANVMTRGPSGRLGALLRLLRPAVDELLVAVDDRADPTVVGSALAVADRVVSYPYAEPVDRPLAWLHAACSGDWVLTIDDDEIPSHDLLEALPELVRADDVTHFWLPRRWLFPDRAHYLDEAPWSPDYQARLVLNDRRLVRFPDETHKPVVVLGPSRYLELPLYHADTLLTTIEHRRSKALAYERADPGKRIAGRPMNELYYVPERAESPRTAAVPQPDASLVQLVLEAGDAAPSDRSSNQVPAVGRGEIDRLWAGRALGDSAYQAHLDLVAEPTAFAAGEVRALDVRVENLGDERWPWGSEVRPEIRLAHRWRDGNGRLVVPDGLRTPLPGDVEPGGSAIVPVAVAAPTAAGSYVVEIDLVHEHVRWFGCEISRQIEVRPRRRAGVLAESESAAAALVARLAEEAPDLEPVALGAGLSYLGEELPASRTGGALLGLRALRLALGARAELLRPPAPGREFLEKLRRVDVLVVGAASASVQASALLAARAVGVPAVLVDEPEPGRLVDRALLAAGKRGARRGLASLTTRPSRRLDLPDARELPEWEYVPDGWRRAEHDRRVRGWDVDDVAGAIRTKWPAFVQAVSSNGPLGVYHEIREDGEISGNDPAAHNLVLTFGYVLGLAAGGRTRLSVLDWGGGTGQYAFLARALRPDLELDYHVKELPGMAALGRELAPDVSFHEDERCLDRRYDLVVASGSLQYVEHWGTLLARLGAAAGRFLYVTRVPVAVRAPSFVVLQRAYAYGYGTEYLGWVVNRRELLDRASSAGLTLVRELLLEAALSAAAAPEVPVRHRGFLWAPAEP